MSGDRISPDPAPDTTPDPFRSVGGGRYVLGELLGQGGMASVHLAHDTVLDRPVAVKTLHTELGREQSFRERFRREAQAVARLNHVNIVAVYDSGEDRAADGAVVPYIVMEYVEGRPLRDILDEHLARHGVMPAREALEIVADVLAALSESHGTGLVHRDIKPGNVMVARRGRTVKVMDFGIARAMQSGVSSMTRTGMVVGTPQYLSPEQALGRGVDERSDLYSVGCLLFELLTGRLPFDGDSPLSIAYQHVQQAPPAPSRFHRAVSPAADALVGRALRKNPAERFPTAAAMRDEVRRVAAAERGADAMPVAAMPTAAAPDPVAPGPATVPGPMAAGPHTPPPIVPPVAERSYQQPPTVPLYQPAQRYAAPEHGPGYRLPGHPAPPPATTVRSGPREGRGARRTAVVVMVAGAAVFVLFMAAVITSARSSGDNGRTDSTGYDTPSSPSPSTRSATGDSSGVARGARNDTIDTSRCTDASTSYVRNNSVFMPNFYGKYVDSVTECMDAAGWKYEIKYQNEALFGKGAVVRQSPEVYFNPDGQTVTIWVSTGEAEDGGKRGGKHENEDGGKHGGKKGH